MATSCEITDRQLSALATEVEWVAEKQADNISKLAKLVATQAIAL